MANPEDIEFSQAFRNARVIYNKNGFSMYVGQMVFSSNPILAVRYNGEEGKTGLPYAFNHP